MLRITCIAVVLASMSFAAGAAAQERVPPGPPIVPPRDATLEEEADVMARDPASSAGVRMRLRLFGQADRATRAFASNGWTQDASGAGGIWGRVSIAHDVGELRLASTVHAAHVILPGRDALDVTAIAGATWALGRGVRAGVEYVAKDVEGALDDGEAEGMRHYAGPALTLDLLRGKLALTCGSAMALQPAASPLVHRVGLALSF